MQQMLPRPIGREGFVRSEKRRPLIELDARRIFRTLNKHGVQYVVIGGYGGVLYGIARTTDDVDITPATDNDNLSRLAAALRELDARLMPPGVEEPVQWPWSADSFAQFTRLTTRTAAGDLDICPRPDAPGGRTFDYERFAANAVIIDLDVDVPTAALEDIIASKEASGREKDEEGVRVLRDLLARRGSRHPTRGGPLSPEEILRFRDADRR